MKKENKQKKIDKKIISITIGYLYGDLMNIYGDNGNIITLRKRLEWRGVTCNVVNISLNDILKKGDVDLYFFGGGQDGSQVRVSEDIQGKAAVIKSDVEAGVPLLSICGGYQLLGDYYKPLNAPKLAGIGIFQAFTDASLDRMIGNIVVDTEQFGTLVGFENHSGKTFLKKGAQALGTVAVGFGNNGGDGNEGCVYKNAIGCYMHGSLLPKNPQLADWLIEKALETKYGKAITLEKIDDNLEETAHSIAISRINT